MYLFRFSSLLQISRPEQVRLRLQHRLSDNWLGRMLDWHGPLRFYRSPSYLNLGRLCTDSFLVPCRRRRTEEEPLGRGWASPRSRRHAVLLLLLWDVGTACLHSKSFWDLVRPTQSHLTNLMVKQVAAEMGSAVLREKTLSLGIALK